LQQAAFGDGHADTMETMTSVLRVIEELKSSVHSSRDLTDTGNACFKEGRYDESLLLAQQALTMSLKADGEEHVDSIVMMSNVGLIFNKLERHEGALEMHEKVLVLRSRVLG
jgi:HEPN domain-containing protein